MILFLFLVFQSCVNAQWIPLGLDISPEGKVLFSHFPPNFNGNLDDTTYILENGEQYLWDRRNVNYSFLTIFEAPEEYVSSNLQPSRMYDTTGYFEPVFVGSQWVSHYNFDFTDRVYPVADSLSETYDPDKFYDELQGLGLNDSIGKVLKRKVEEYAYRYMGNMVPEEVEKSLQVELSEVDTVINGKYVYDYLADQFKYYTYQNDKLVRAIAYEWNGSVEFDSLKYDLKGNLVYFSREQIGVVKDEYCFEYNTQNKLVEVSYNNYYFGYPEQDRIPRVWEFGYDKKGVINRRFELLTDGSWSSVYFQREPFELSEK